MMKAINICFFLNVKKKRSICTRVHVVTVRQRLPLHMAL